MFNEQRSTKRVDYNWIVTDSVESLAAYVDTFNLGKLVPLTDILPTVTDEQMAEHGLLALANARRETIMQLPSTITEQTTFYSVLSAKEWTEMKHDLTKPRSPLSNTLKGMSLSNPTWLMKWTQSQFLSSAFTFVMSNSAIVNEDTFWEIRFANSDVWRRLVAEHVPPEHQYKRRTK